MSFWYDDAIFYHMYPLGMVGAEKRNTVEKTEHRFDEMKNGFRILKRSAAMRSI